MLRCGGQRGADQPTCHTNAPGTSEGYYAEIYPSLMDPASPSPNFDVVGELPYIYFMSFHNSVPSPSGGETVVRSIQRRPLRMSGAAVAAVPEPDEPEFTGAGRGGDGA